MYIPCCFMSFSKIKAVVFCLFMFLLTVVVSCRAKTRCDNTALQILKQIPLDDQKHLESFWRRVIRQDQFGFALFGSKAAATTGYFESLRSGNIHLMPFDHIRKKEFEAWKKYKAYFQSNNFIWVVGSNVRCERLIDITFIQREKFLKVVSANLKIFQLYLKEDITPEELFERLKTCNQEILVALNHREDLFGILLGFGDEASSEYQRRDELMQALLPPPPLKIEKIEPFDFDTAEDEYKFLKNNLYARNKDGLKYTRNRHIFLFRPVIFMNLGSDESMGLIKKYGEDQEKVANLFHNRKFLEVILEQIHAENPICLE